MTVWDAIRSGAERLAAAGVESSRLESEWLLAHVLGVPRLRLVLEAGRAVTEGEARAFSDLVASRATRRPLQHLVGSVSFCGFEFAVNPSVLIPRPETELLAERAWLFLLVPPQPWTHAPVVLDFGTGSGCLAVTLAVKCPAAVVHAVDISPDALAVARGNAARHGVDGRVSFHLGDGFAALPEDVRFDLLVGNPPYIPSGEIAGLQPEVRDHDPRLALDGGADGLDFYRRIAHEAPAWLRPEARVMLEFGDGQGGALRALFSGGRWRCEGIFPDDSGRERILIAAVARA
ncbi:release factor glutamine methyltransferase [Verrucomicrobiota bacterium]|nr:release factor glutamine methyltransferase [Verrucomicrobiota bacterium]